MSRTVDVQKQTAGQLSVMNLPRSRAATSSAVAGCEKNSPSSRLDSADQAKYDFFSPNHVDWERKFALERNGMMKKKILAEEERKRQLGENDAEAPARLNTNNRSEYKFVNEVTQNILSNAEEGEADDDGGNQILVKEKKARENAFSHSHFSESDVHVSNTNKSEKQGKSRNQEEGNMYDHSYENKVKTQRRKVKGSGRRLRKSFQNMEDGGTASRKGCGYQSSVDFRDHMGSDAPTTVPRNVKKMQSDACENSSFERSMMKCDAGKTKDVQSVVTGMEREAREAWGGVQNADVLMQTDVTKSNTKKREDSSSNSLSTTISARRTEGMKKILNGKMKLNSCARESNKRRGTDSLRNSSKNHSNSTNISKFGINTSINGTNSSNPGTNISNHGTHNSNHCTKSFSNGTNSFKHDTNSSNHGTNISMNGSTNSKERNHLETLCNIQSPTSDKGLAKRRSKFFSIGALASSSQSNNCNSNYNNSHSNSRFNSSNSNSGFNSSNSNSGFNNSNSNSGFNSSNSNSGFNSSNSNSGFNSSNSNSGFNSSNSNSGFNSSNSNSGFNSSNSNSGFNSSNSNSGFNSSNSNSGFNSSNSNSGFNSSNRNSGFDSSKRKRYLSCRPPRSNNDNASSCHGTAVDFTARCTSSLSHGEGSTECGSTRDTFITGSSDAGSSDTAIGDAGSRRRITMERRRKGWEASGGSRYHWNEGRKWRRANSIPAKNVTTCTSGGTSTVRGTAGSTLKGTAGSTEKGTAESIVKGTTNTSERASGAVPGSVTGCTTESSTSNETKSSTGSAARSCKGNSGERAFRSAARSDARNASGISSNSCTGRAVERVVINTTGSTTGSAGSTTASGAKRVTGKTAGRRVTGNISKTVIGNGQGHTARKSKGPNHENKTTSSNIQSSEGTDSSTAVSIPKCALKGTTESGSGGVSSSSASCESSGDYSNGSSYELRAAWTEENIKKYCEDSRFGSISPMKILSNVKKLDDSSMGILTLNPRKSQSDRNSIEITLSSPEEVGSGSSMCSKNSSQAENFTEHSQHCEEYRDAKRTQRFCQPKNVAANLRQNEVAIKKNSVSPNNNSFLLQKVCLEKKRLIEVTDDEEKDRDSWEEQIRETADTQKPFKQRVALETEFLIPENIINSERAADALNRPHEQKITNSTYSASSYTKCGTNSGEYLGDEESDASFGHHLSSYDYRMCGNTGDDDDVDGVPDDEFEVSRNETDADEDRNGDYSRDLIDGRKGIGVRSAHGNTAEKELMHSDESSINFSDRDEILPW
ncbi:hypothetical protein FHG87_017087 [Trinorchestia longiramus]|nr:hypothetical protein FHG87_017087 [Trinorchestia longiramus]